MDDSDIFKVSGTSAGIISILLLLYRVLRSVQGKRLVSNCCGKKLEVGFEVKESMETPKEVCIEIKNPMPKQNELNQTN